MEDYLSYREPLAQVFAGENKANIIESTGRPTADEFLLESVYEGFREAADTTDGDIIADIINELEQYEIPAPDNEIIKQLLEKADISDYAGMIEILDTNSR